MIPLKYIRENREIVEKSLSAKRVDFDLDVLLENDSKWRILLKNCEDLKSTRNSVSKEIAKLKSQGADCDDKILYMKEVSSKIKESDRELSDIEKRINNDLLYIPNIIHDSVPIGKTEEDNVVIREYGEKPTFDFEVKDHLKISEKLNLLDMPRGAKISGSGFPLYVGRGAKLERSLISFMLDQHTDNGYTELFPPFLSNQNTTQVTGQLPKFEEDMYYIDRDDLYCIPTAEVPITSYYKNETLLESELPKKFTAYSACFRREAGSYGKDTKGLLRLHQFNKVELVKFVSPKDSYSELELLLNDAEKILQLLNLHYRVVELNSSDLSFSAAKCYDIEVWSPAEEKYLEVSSCSNFEAFQAQRGNIRFRDNENKLQHVHTLNGSGVATPRLMVSILENYQDKNGFVAIPQVLQKYFNEKIIK